MIADIPKRNNVVSFGTCSRAPTRSSMPESVKRFAITVNHHSTTQLHVQSISRTVRSGVYFSARDRRISMPLSIWHSARESRWISISQRQSEVSHILLSLMMWRYDIRISASVSMRMPSWSILSVGSLMKIFRSDEGKKRNE